MIFISYSWENKSPNINVLEFVSFLRCNGYDAKCDVMYMQQETALSFQKMMAECLREADKVILVLSEEYKNKADSFSGGVGDEYQYIIKDIKENVNKYILISFEAINNNLDRIVPDFLRGREVVDLVADENNDYKKLFLKLNNEKEFQFPDVNPNKRHILPIKLGGSFNYQFWKEEIPVKDAVRIVNKQSRFFKSNKFKIVHKKYMIEFSEHIIELLLQLREMVSNDYLLKECHNCYMCHDYYEITQELLLYEGKIDEIIREAIGKNANYEIEKIKKSDMWFEMMGGMVEPELIRNPQLVYKEISETIGTLKAAIQLLQNKLN